MKTKNKVVPFKNESLIEIKLESVGDSVIDCVSSRELYLKLGHNVRRWVRWYAKNILENEWFLENRDWVSVPTLVHFGQGTTDFLVTVEFAKHIAMMAKTQKAHEYRNYLIACEKKLISNQFQQLEAAQERLKHVIPLHPNTPKSILGITKNSDINALYLEMEKNGHARRREELKPVYKWEITTEGVEAYGGYNSQSGIRFSSEYHEALKKLLIKVLHNDQVDWIFSNY